MIVSLSHAGISRIVGRNDFEIRTNDGTISCSKGQASFLSPKIANLLYNDPTINFIQLATPNSSACLKILQNIITGNPIFVESGKINIFRSISQELKNEELFKATCDLELNKDNALDIITQKSNIGFDISTEVNFIASSFTSFDQKKLAKLDVSILECILRSESLLVESEGSVLQFLIEVRSLYGSAMAPLFGCLHLEYLSINEIETFISIVDLNSIGFYWPSICQRLLCPVRSINGDFDDKLVREKTIDYCGDNFDGIFAYLWEMTGGNPVSNEIIQIKGPTNNAPHNSIEFLVDPNKRVENDWVCSTLSGYDIGYLIDMKNRKVSLKGYSLKAHSSFWNGNWFLKSWKVEGSNDKKRWTSIDRRTTTELQHNLAEGYWEVSPSHPFRYFRIMMLEKNTSNFYYFGLHAIEIFGKIITE